LPAPTVPSCWAAERAQPALRHERRLADAVEHGMLDRLGVAPPDAEGDALHDGVHQPRHARADVADPQVRANGLVAAVVHDGARGEEAFRLVAVTTSYTGTTGPSATVEHRQPRDSVAVVGIGPPVLRAARVPATVEPVMDECRRNVEACLGLADHVAHGPRARGTGRGSWRDRGRAGTSRISARRAAALSIAAAARRFLDARQNPISPKPTQLLGLAALHLQHPGPPAGRTRGRRFP
jgi:hypothetical protein